MARLPIELTETTGLPYYRQAEDQLVRLIRAGEVKPGELLPSVRELSEQLGVSEITIRRAYDDLTRQGLLVRKRGQGTFVSSDVQTTLRAHSLAEAEDGLAEALLKARQMGLRGQALKDAVERLLGEE